MGMPRIFLSLDNCFAIKRWVEPKEWMGVARELGFNVMEASTDNECDPLYNPQSYLKEWLQSVQEAQKKQSIQIGSFFTGYQSYRTVGLAHSDSRVREQLLSKWFDPMFKMAGDLSAALGVYFHALTNETLQSPQIYKDTEQILIDSLSRASVLALKHGGVKFCYEQMYSPQQTPWTINGTKDMLRQVLDKSGAPMYVALDVGHQYGQKSYQQPSREVLEKELERLSRGEEQKVWIGSDFARDLAAHVTQKSIKDVTNRIIEDMEKHPYLFSSPEDSDPYAWLEKLGCYSPIIHLQQTDGLSSHHAPFTADLNKKGIIHPKQVLSAIKKSFEQPEDPSMPQKAENIFLTFEIFSGTADPSHAILTPLRESLEYWRNVIPCDGCRLDELVP